MASADIVGSILSCKEIYAGESDRFRVTSGQITISGVTLENATGAISGQSLFAVNGFNGIMSTVSGTTVTIVGGIITTIA